MVWRIRNRPEEIPLLTAFLLLRACHVDLFARIGILARVEHHRRERHRRGGQVLHLFEREMQPAQHLAGQRLHVAFGAARVRRDEVGDQLVVEPVAAADRAEVVVEPLEKGEGRFAHQCEHPLLGVLGSDFEPSRRVMADDRLQVVASVEEVVADAAADEGLLDPLYGADLGVEIEQRPVVVVQVGADARVQTRGAPAAGAERAVAAAHAVHVGRGGADVGEVTPEIGHRRDAAHLVENRPLRPRVDELALMRRNGAEGAAAEAAAVDVD